MKYVRCCLLFLVDLYHKYLEKKIKTVKYSFFKNQTVLGKALDSNLLSR
jgi:hypothetical protein